MGKYKVLKKLGQGSYGTVYLVQDSRDGENFVMKKITVSGMTEQELADCKKEIQILSVMDHPCIVKYKRSFVRRGALCIVMEYADGGDLHAMIKSHREAKEHFDEDQILNWFTQACLGLKHVHDHKILHRDLKTQNIFLTVNGEVRLGDFGISRVLKNTMDQANTLVGTPYYLSPEMVNGLAYNHTSDIWSMGVVLYEMCTLQHPFNADSLQMLALKIIQGNYPPIPSQYSTEISDLLSHMLEQNAKGRYDINQVLTTPIIFERISKFMPNHPLLGVQLGSNSSDPTLDSDTVSPLKRVPRTDRTKSDPIDGLALSQETKLKNIPSHSKSSLPPTPPVRSSHLRSASKEVFNHIHAPEPDWEVGKSVESPLHGNRQAQFTRGNGEVYQEPSVSRGTQEQILRSYLEERLGAHRLEEVLHCLRSTISDESKQKQVDCLTKGHKGLLPIVHTYLYLAQARSTAKI